MFYNLNFDVPANRVNGGKVGIVTIPSGISFEIRKFAENAFMPGESQKYGIKVRLWGDGLDLFGAFGAGDAWVDLTTQGEVIAYLTQQLSKDLQYAELRAKRKALADRMKPLQDKWFKTGEAIIQLAKV